LLALFSGVEKADFGGSEAGTPGVHLSGSGASDFFGGV